MKKKKSIQVDWNFTKDLKDRIIIHVPHNMKMSDFPFVVDIVPKSKKRRGFLGLW